MSEIDAVLLACLLFAGAALYASVGQSGATAFIAAMGIIGLPASTIRPSVLALNILAASFSTWRFHRAGLVTWSRLRRFALASAPASFVGGAIALPDLINRPVIGIVLLIAALLLLRRATTGGTGGADASRPAAMPLELLTGGMIGFLAGLTATG